jgi:hypothetical protein
VSPIKKELLKNWKKFVRRPALALGFVIYETAYYGAALLGYIVSAVSINPK